MATAAERAAGLTPFVEEATRAVADLETQIAQAEGEARSAYVAGHAETGRGAQARVEKLSADLPAAKAHLETLKAAELTIAGERAREEHQAQLDRLKVAEMAALDVAQRALAEVLPSLSACKLAAQTAESAEREANRLEHERRAMEVTLGYREHGRYTPAHNRFDVLAGEEPLIRKILQHPGL